MFMWHSITFCAGFPRHYALSHICSWCGFVDGCSFEKSWAFAMYNVDHIFLEHRPFGGAVHRIAVVRHFAAGCHLISPGCRWWQISCSSMICGRPCTFAHTWACLAGLNKSVHDTLGCPKIPLVAGRPWYTRNPSRLPCDYTSRICSLHLSLPCCKQTCMKSVVHWVSYTLLLLRYRFVRAPKTCILVLRM